MSSKQFINSMPAVIGKHLSSKNIISAKDSYVLCTKSMRQLLLDAGSKTIVDECGDTYSVDIYDDWHLTGVGTAEGYIFSLVKIREPGDEQANWGNTIPFVELDIKALADCIRAKDQAGIYAILTKVTNPSPKDQSEAIRRYFADYNSEGSYLIAEYTVKKVIKHKFSGTRTWQLEHDYSVNDKWAKAYLEKLSSQGIYDTATNSIRINDPKKLSTDEKNALLMMATGNVSTHSYAGENLWHALMLGDNSSKGFLKTALAMVGLSIDEHAIASDASVGSLSVEQMYEKAFKDPVSDIYTRLASLHKDWL